MITITAILAVLTIALLLIWDRRRKRSYTEYMNRKRSAQIDTFPNASGLFDGHRVTLRPGTMTMPVDVAKKLGLDYVATDGVALVSANEVRGS